MIAPSKNRVTQGKHGQYNAVDYSASPDPTFYAPEDGRITAYGPSGTCGNRLELTAGANRHGFCHLERPLVGVGQTVRKGQPIGVMGYTGYTIPAGPGGRHLHWVINRGGNYIYPPSLVNETINEGDDMFRTDAEVREAYLLLRGSIGTQAERNAWIGQPKQRFFQVGKPEADSTRKQLTDVRKALSDLQAQPPKEVVKIVKEIVEVPVEKITVKEVVVDKTDELSKDTNTKVTAIFDYFSARWQTFKDFLTRRNK